MEDLCEGASWDTIAEGLCDCYADMDKQDAEEVLEAFWNTIYLEYEASQERIDLERGCKQMALQVAFEGWFASVTGTLPETYGNGEYQGDAVSHEELVKRYNTLIAQ